MPVPSAPGTVTWGSLGYVEYVAGNSPIIISAPHGGYLLPPSLADRTYGVLLPDRRTQELAREIADAIAVYTGQRPHLIISHLSRLKLDPNREIVEAAQGDPQAEIAWHEFHGFLTTATTTVTAQHGRGLLLDIHGHSHPIDRLELGYALTAASLALPDSTLNDPAIIDTTTIRSLASQPGAYFPEILRGTTSLGGLLQSAGLDSLPSPVFPDPAGNPYFTGGYIVRQHGSRDAGTVDAIQIESPFSIRDSSSSRAPLVAALGPALQVFFQTHYGVNLLAGERVSVAVIDGIATETGSVSEIVVQRTGSASIQQSVQLAYAGSATAGVDYSSLPQSVTLGVGVWNQNVPIHALDDALLEGVESIQITLDAGVATAATNQAEVLILDDEGDPSHELTLLMEDGFGSIATDSSGNGWDAALLPTGGVGPVWAVGHSGGGIAFDGVDDHLRLPDAPYAPGGDFSIAFWMRIPPLAGASFQYVYSHGVASQPNSLNIHFSESTGRLRTVLVRQTDLGSALQLDIDAGLADGLWHHFALSSPQSGNTCIFIDGSCRVVTNLGGGAFDPGGDLFIGARQDLNGNRFFQGTLDDIRIASSAITAAEVQAIVWGMGNAAAVCPGSDHDLRLASGPAGVPAFGPMQDVVHLAPGDLLILKTSSPLGTYANDLHILGAQFFNPSFPPMVQAFPALHLSPSGGFIITGPSPLAYPEGASFYASIPSSPTLTGLRFLVQSLAFSSQAPNGIFATTNAHELRF